MKKSIILGVFALTALTFGDCTKAKDGAPGAQGPEGNANVIGSNTVTASNWTLNSGIMYYATLTSSNITQAIVDKGVVLVYEGDASISASFQILLLFESYPIAHKGQFETPFLSISAV